MEHGPKKDAVDHLAGSNQDMIWNLLPYGICVFDKAGAVDAINPCMQSIFAIPDGFTSGRTIFDLLTHDIASEFEELRKQVAQSGRPLLDVERWVGFSNAAGKWLSICTVPALDTDGAVQAVICSSRDITERKESEGLMLAQANLLDMVAQSQPLSEIFARIIAVIEDQVQGALGSVEILSTCGSRLQRAIAPRLPAAFVDLMENLSIGPLAATPGITAWSGEQIFVPDVLVDPRWRTFVEQAVAHRLRSCWSVPIQRHDGSVQGVFSLYSHSNSLPTPAQTDLMVMAGHMVSAAIERQEADERNTFLANHDALTGLPNRLMFEQRLAAALNEARATNGCLGLAFLDLDKFKRVNDTLGHAAGDELLQIVARRSVSALPKDAFVARLGGGADSAGWIRDTLCDVRAAIVAPIDLAGRPLQTTCSLGIALFPQDGDTSEELLRKSDLAMYRAKKLGRDRVLIFQESMIKDPPTQPQTHQLRNALVRGEFVLRYQPQLDILTGRIVGAEALVRWNHPELGLVPPGDFIPAAEASGLIVPIGDWILSTAVAQNKLWQDQGLPPITVSVNVSARQFVEPRWIASVMAALGRSGLQPHLLELELTESMIMQDVPSAIRKMHQLRAVGIQLAIDDFGTGYSNLKALRTLPVHRLKIDRSFMADIPVDEGAANITRAIIALAGSLNMGVVAEGIESQPQLDFLRDSGCTIAQGYIFSPAVNPDTLATLLTSFDLGTTSRAAKSFPLLPSMAC